MKYLIWGLIIYLFLTRSAEEAAFAILTAMVLFIFFWPVVLVFDCIATIIKKLFEK